MSHIFGKGWGDDHDWIRGSTNEAGSWGTKATHYQCANCKETFSHYYDNVPDIFIALERSGVPEHCTTPPSEHNASSKLANPVAHKEAKGGDDE